VVRAKAAVGDSFATVAITEIRTLPRIGSMSSRPVYCPRSEVPRQLHDADPMLDVAAGHPAPITTPIETAQRFSGAVTALKQSMIDDATVPAFAALDRHYMPGMQLASGDLIRRDTVIVVHRHHGANRVSVISARPFFRHIEQRIWKISPTILQNGSMRGWFSSSSFVRNPL
jgi:hypothetical protein